MTFYFAAAFSATIVCLSLALRRRHPGWLFGALALIVGCGGRTGEPMGSGGMAGAAATTSTTSSTTTGTQECSPPCALPQVCGIGCGTSIGCYTPGGSRDAGPNDCPACFRSPSNDGQCTINGLGEAYACQKGAAPLGGCINGGVLECCPSATCSGVAPCPVGFVSQCGPSDAVAACCDQMAKRPTIACARKAGLLVTGCACDAACGVSGSECAATPTGLVCCSTGPTDPCNQ